MEQSNERLEKLINFFSKTGKTATDFIPDEETYKMMFIQEITNIKNLLNRKSFNIENHTTFGFLIQQYQVQIAEWLNHLFDVKEKENGKYQEWVIRFITEELEALLAFIYTRYQTFFNLDEKLPEISLEQIRASLKERVQKLRKLLVKEFKNEAQVELALLPLKKILNANSKDKISYRYLFYTRRIEKTLADFIHEIPSCNCCENERIIELIVLLNYNCKEAQHFIINTITAELEKEDTLESKLNRLRFYLKEFRQLGERPKVAYKSYTPSLKEQIVGWISEEIIYQERRVVSSSAIFVDKENTIAYEEKVQLTFSVEVFAIMVRAAKDNKLVMVKHAMEFFKIIPKYFSTKQATTISTHSLRNKSYTAELSAKREAIDILHAMIKRIHEY